MVRIDVKAGGWALVVGVLSASVFASVSAEEVDQAAGLALAERSACMACHQVDAKRVGPPLRSVGERYAAAGEGDAMVQYLAGKIRSGGRGVWGAVPMPAQSQVSEEDARALAKWVLSLAPARPE